MGVSRLHRWAFLAAHEGMGLSEASLAEWLTKIYSGEWGEEWRGHVIHWRAVFEDAFLTFTMSFDDREYLQDQSDKRTRDDLPRRVISSLVAHAQGPETVPEQPEQQVGKGRAPGPVRPSWSCSQPCKAI